MIEIKLLSEDIEGIRDLGILLLQNNIVYRIRKKGRFVIFEICHLDEWLACSKNGICSDKDIYCNFSLQFERFEKPIEFKAFALKIY
jgi:hypothetical protein